MWKRINNRLIRHNDNDNDKDKDNENVPCKFCKKNCKVLHSQYFFGRTVKICEMCNANIKFMNLPGTKFT
jgi:hypothetical protein